MDIEHTREKAHRLADAGHWWEALRLFTSLAEALEARGEADPAIHSRIGEIHLRVDDRDAAIRAWKAAVEGFLLEGLPDSALAVCRKIVRYSPEPEEIYLRMGQIRARQGLLIYARKHFLTYAEMVGQRGDVDEAIRAMEELLSWVPSDLETRLFLAERLLAEGRREKALVYLREGYWRALWERNEEALEVLRPRVLELDPGADLGPLPPEGAGAAEGPDATGVSDATSAEERARRAEGGVWARILQEELRRRSKAPMPAEATAPAAPAPTEEEPAAEGRTGWGDGPGGTAAAPADEAPPPPAGTSPAVDQDEVAPAAIGAGDKPPPEAPEARRSNFSQLLSQFKEETASHADEREARAQYELGIANHEMGLIDGAISLFEKALSIRPDYLPAVEMLGRCHLEKDAPEEAIRSMESSLELDIPVEDDLLGIYYHLGRANEELGRQDAARAWYERVFAIDINFLDVIERLRPLR